MQAFQEEDYTRRFDPGLWKKLLKLAAPFRRNLWVIVVTMAFSALIDVVLPTMNSYAIDTFIANETTAGLPLFAVLYALLIAAQVGFVLLLVFLFTDAFGSQ